MSRRGNREGTIYKHKRGFWCGQVTLGYNPETGKPVRKTFYGKTRQEVAEKLTRALREAQIGLLTPREKMNLAQWLNLWLDLYKKPILRTTTYERYAGLIKNHIVPTLGSLPLEKLRPEQIQSFYLEKEKEGLSGRSVQFIHVVLHGALKQAVKLGYLPYNPCERTQPPKAKAREIRILTKEELERFLSCAREHRLYPAFFLLATTGLRRGELLGLRWQDVDLERGTITVNQNLVSLNRGVAFQEPKSKAGGRSIPLLPEAVEVLKEWRKKWLEEKLKLGPGWPDCDLVFPSEVHTPIYPRNFTRVFYEILKKANLSGVTIHSLRHTYATLLLEAGEHPKVVQELLGHSSITMTLDTYSKVVPGLKERAVEKLGGLLKGVLPRAEE